MERKRNFYNIKENIEDTQWKEKEKLFHKRQMTERALLRVREQRGTIFDFLFVNTVSCGFISIKPDAIQLLLNSSIDDISEIKEQVLVIKEFETDSKIIDYWDSIISILDYFRPNLQVTKATTSLQHSNPQILEEINRSLQEKSYEQLNLLEANVRKKLNLKDIDPEYWEALLHQIIEFKLKQRLLECQKLLIDIRKREDPKIQEIPFKSSENNSQLVIPSDQEVNEDDIPWDPSPISIALFNSSSDKIPRSRQLRFQGEALDIPRIKHSWEDTIKPRKPRYYALAFMKIEWTKYNQAHFSSKNPPPATPQGFCFNIFYPELCDPKKVPYYLTEPDPKDPENSQLVRFVGDAPYIDLVFRIPAHRWELGHRHGFICTFERHTLCLNFRFRKHFYKR